MASFVWMHISRRVACNYCDAVCYVFAFLCSEFGTHAWLLQYRLSVLPAAVKSAMIVLLFCMADGVDVERGVLRGRFLSIVFFTYALWYFALGAARMPCRFFTFFLAPIRSPFSFTRAFQYLILLLNGVILAFGCSKNMGWLTPPVFRSKTGG